MGIADKIDGLRDAEEKALMFRITKYVAKKLNVLYGDKWKAVEISKATGIPGSRLSEIKHWQRYQLPISERNLKLLIEGEIVTLNQLKTDVAESEKEQEHLDSRLAYVDDIGHREIYNQAKELELDPTEIIAEYIKNHKR